MKKKLIVCLGLSVLASPTFIKSELKYIEPTPSKPVRAPHDSDFINNKMKQLRRRKK